MSVIVSCSGKFHAFALAEQLHRHGMLTGLYTSYAYQKNQAFRKLAGRIDKENIPPSLIHTAIPLAIGIKGWRKDWFWNECYDRLTALRISSQKDYKIFIGWSGMSLHSLRQAKRDGKLTILERGSSHILYQNEILKDEYKKFDIDFQIHPKVIEKELKEYAEADYISIPSIFAKQSFIEYGVDQKKLFHNPYGTSSYFQRHVENELESKAINRKFRIVYLGNLTVQKGVIYLFEAIEKLDIPIDSYELWLIGNVSDEIKSTLDRYKKDNWKVFRHVKHYDLPGLLVQCDIGIQPSLQEGLSMVIVQMIASGIPVIATTNTGGEDIIKDSVNGFIIPIRSPEAIAEKIEYLYYNPEKLELMKESTQNLSDMSWDAYGDRYVEFIKKLM